MILLAKLLLCPFKENEKDRQQYFSEKISEQVRYPVFRLRNRIMNSAVNYPCVMLHAVLQSVILILNSFFSYYQIANLLSHSRRNFLNQLMIYYVF